jgi:large subunit ribosomal protein L29
MKIAEIRQLTNDELQQKLKDSKQELFNLRFANATGSLKNPMQIRLVKKDIAKIQTILRERELSEKKA